MSNGLPINYLKPAGKPFKGKNKPARKKLRQVSKKLREKMKIYAKLRKEFLAQHKACCVIVDGVATEIHHAKGRGKYLLDTSTWLAVSREGHRWIHENPSEAENLGLLDPSRNRR